MKGLVRQPATCKPYDSLLSESESDISLFSSRLNFSQDRSLKNPDIDVFELHKICRSTDFEAVKLSAR